jgi:hypothetical protein
MPRKKSKNTTSEKKKNNSKIPVFPNKECNSKEPPIVIQNIAIDQLLLLLLSR